MDKVRERFFYLRMKSLGYEAAVIQEELEVSEAKFKEIEAEYSQEVATTKLKIAETKGIGSKFMELTSSLYGYVSDQMKEIGRASCRERV